MKIAELETQLQVTIDELAADQSSEQEIRSRIAEGESQKRRIESQLATLREQERLKQVEADLGKEVHQLRELGDRINEGSRKLFKLMTEFETLSQSITEKEHELKQKPAVSLNIKPDRLPCVLHTEGEPSIFLMTRAEAEFFRNSTQKTMGRDYQFPLDQILG
jgi:chromosome segregation ATPase